MLDLAALKQYGIAQIGKANVRHAPFDYLTVDALFPLEFNAALLRFMPSYAQFDPASPVGQAIDEYTVSGTEARRSFSLDPQSLARLTPEAQQVWGLFRDFFGSEEVNSKLVQLLVPREEVASLLQQGYGLAPKINLVESFKGYFLGPHTDSPKKLLTGIFYFAADDTQPDLGTAVYVPDDPAYTCDVGKHHAFDGFKQVDFSPYLPNHFFAFHRDKRSFHGFDRFNIRSGRRIVLDYKLNLSKRKT